MVARLAEPVDTLGAANLGSTVAGGAHGRGAAVADSKNVGLHFDGVARWAVFVLVVALLAQPAYRSVTIVDRPDAGATVLEPANLAEETVRRSDAMFFACGTMGPDAGGARHAEPPPVSYLVGALEADHFVAFAALTNVLRIDE